MGLIVYAFTQHILPKLVIDTWFSQGFYFTYCLFFRLFGLISHVFIDYCLLFYHIVKVFVSAKAELRANGKFLV